MSRRHRGLIALPLVLGGLLAVSCNKASDDATAGTTIVNSNDPFALTRDPIKAAGAAGVRMLPAEGTKVHYHPQLTVNINGKNVQVPAYIGISNNAISELHTHDATGRIHIEADQPGTFTLKQLMTEWGVNFDINCVATYCSDANNEMRVYDNGQVAPDPTKVVLKENQQILLWYGPRNQQPNVPTPSLLPGQQPSTTAAGSPAAPTP